MLACRDIYNSVLSFQYFSTKKETRVANILLDYRNVYNFCSHIYVTLQPSKNISPICTTNWMYDMLFYFQTKVT